MLTQVTGTLLLIIGMELIGSVPTDHDSEMECPATTDLSAAVTMPKWIREMLTDGSEASIGLYSVYKNTHFFNEKELYKSEVVCRHM